MCLFTLLGKYVPPGVSKYSFESDVATSHPQAFKHVKTLQGRTRDEGDHWVKVLFNGHIDPPVPIVIDAKVGVVDLNNQLLHVCPFPPFPPPFSSRQGRKRPLPFNGHIDPLVKLVWLI
jgi:hypothetical protein